MAVDPKKEFTIKLLKEIEIRPCIYDPKHPGFRYDLYSSKAAAAWEQIAEKLGKPSKECKARWNIVRSRYVSIYFNKAKRDEYFYSKYIKFYGPVYERRLVDKGLKIRKDPVHEKPSIVKKRKLLIESRTTRNALTESISKQGELGTDSLHEIGEMQMNENNHEVVDEIEIEEQHGIEIEEINEIINAEENMEQNEYSEEHRDEKELLERSCIEFLDAVLPHMVSMIHTQRQRFIDTVIAFIDSLDSSEVQDIRP